ncbi:MAG: 2-hydroxyacyl-CoA dehydratase family protein, partial [Candidatus Binatia bacterium]|nr:2-hydroxyacyl-CoA dehydratase family protein [Candidatus Binatia bacterium]
GVAIATQQLPFALAAGLGPFGRRLYGPYFSKAMAQPEIVTSYHEIADTAGYPAQVMCSSMHHYLGEMLLGLTTKHPKTGKECPVDFVLDTQFCHSASKTAQLAGEFLGVPHFVLDVPQEGGEVAVEYTAAQMGEAIDWMIKITGKEYHDEWLIEAAQNWWESNVIWSQICYANQAIPAPLDYHLIHDLMIPFMLGGHEREVVEFGETLLGEVEDRVREGISSQGLETCRLAHEGEPMWYASSFVTDLLHKFGAVLVGGFTAFSGGLWTIDENDRWTPAPRLRELNVNIRNRDDVLNFLARAYIYYAPIYRCQRAKIGEYLNRARDWKCDGVVIHQDIGCRSQLAGVLEAEAMLKKEGIPVVTYEASNGDPRDFTPEQVEERLEAFLERIGLDRLS